MPKKSDGLLRRFDLFIFDWDGTLNNMHLALKMYEGLKRIFRIWNADSSIKDFKHVNYNLRKSLVRKERVNDVLATLFDIFFVFYRPKLHNDTIKMLEMLKRRNKYTAVFSNGRSYRLLKEISYLGVTNYFDVIVSAKTIKAMKPNPTGLKAITSALGVKPERTLYIGDMIDDILTAKLAHISSCAIADGFDSYHKLRSINPTYMYKSIEAFMEAL